MKTHLPSIRAIWILFLALTLLTPLAVFPHNAQAATDGIAYYVDCNGSDNNNGLSPSSPWRSLDKANSASLVPGDKLYLKRGCTWNGPLQARWAGTAGQPILISAYGSGSLPVIQNAYESNVAITGSNQIIEYIRVRSDPPNRDPNCNNQSYGWKIGFHFLDNSSYNTVRNSQATELTAGVRITYSSHHNRVLNNKITNNNMMQIVDSAPNNDLGPWGIALLGQDNEIGFNYLANNNSWCSYDYGIEGSAIEVFKAQRNNIHHNKSLNDKIFSELGGTATEKAADNVFAYNQYVSSLKDSNFLVVRGGKISFGPTWRTKAYNNTIYLTHPTSAGIVCGDGCSRDILSAHNNIVWAEWKSMFADAPFDEGHNIYWNSAGDPFVQFLNFNMSATSKITAPQFVNKTGNNFRLVVSSPAVDAGMNPNRIIDLDGVSLPQGVGYDIGAYEYKFDSSALVATEDLPLDNSDYPYQINVPFITVVP